MPTTLEAFGSSFDLNASRVLNPPSLIFLCGGSIQNSGEPPASLRGLFYQRLKQDHPELCPRVLLAEEANQWSKAASYYDHLFALEDDLAYLSAAIMLFVESPGSIAELGAFCNVDALSKKLIAVLEHNHQNDESFIQDGPIALLRKNDPRSVLFYPWLGPPNECGKRLIEPIQSKDTVDRLIERLLDEISNVSKEEKFNANNVGHRILLVADLVKLGGIIKSGEIESLLEGAGLAIATQSLYRYLFLLEKLKLIDKTQYGHITYYLSLFPPNEFIRYARTTKGLKSDRFRLKSDLSQTLQPLDRDRGKAFEAFSKKTSGSNG